MKQHARVPLVRDAEQKLRTAIVGATRELTIWESIQVVSLVLNGELLGIAKYRIREERHGTTDTPGDVEGPTLEEQLKLQKEFTEDSVHYTRLFYTGTSATVVHGEMHRDEMLEKYPHDWMDRLFEDVGVFDGED